MMFECFTKVDSLFHRSRRKVFLFYSGLFAKKKIEEFLKVLEHKILEMKGMLLAGLGWREEIIVVCW